MERPVQGTGRHEGGGFPPRGVQGKALSSSAPPKYRLTRPRSCPVIGKVQHLIEEMLRSDVGQPKKQQHAARRIYIRLRDEYGFEGSEPPFVNTLQSYANAHLRCSYRWSTMLVPMHRLTLVRRLSSSPTCGRRSSYSASSSAIAECPSSSLFHTSGKRRFLKATARPLSFSVGSPIA